jgi:hypothetical protein
LGGPGGGGGGGGGGGYGWRLEGTEAFGTTPVLGGGQAAVCWTAGCLARGWRPASILLSDTPLPPAPQPATPDPTTGQHGVDKVWQREQAASWGPQGSGVVRSRLSSITRGEHVPAAGTNERTPPRSVAASQACRSHCGGWHAWRRARTLGVTAPLRPPNSTATPLSPPRRPRCTTATTHLLPLPSPATLTPRCPPTTSSSSAAAPSTALSPATCWLSCRQARHLGLVA